MSKQVTTIPRENLTDDMLVKSATLFSENYGIWGTAPEGTGIPGRPGARVRMNAARLRKQSLPEGTDSICVQATIHGVLVGHAFACRWKYEDHRVLWITQLVVHSDFRKRRIATTLLINCLDGDEDVFGIMSSHPAACKALAKAFGDVPFTEIPLDFAKNHASGVLNSSPIAYIRDAEPCGSIFDPDDATGMVMGANSHFFVDHQSRWMHSIHSRLTETGHWGICLTGMSSCSSSNGQNAAVYRNLIAGYVCDRGHDEALFGRDGEPRGLKAELKALLGTLETIKPSLDPCDTLDFIPAQFEAS